MPFINYDLLELIEIVQEINNIDDSYLDDFYI